MELLAKRMRTRHAIAGLKEKSLANRAAEWAELECLRIVAKWAFRLHLLLLLLLLIAVTGDSRTCWFSRSLPRRSVVWASGFHKWANRCHLLPPQSNTHLLLSTTQQVNKNDMFQTKFLKTTENLPKLN